MSLAVDHCLTVSGTAYFLESWGLNLVGEMSGCGNSRIAGNGICPRGKHNHHLVLPVSTFLVTAAALRE